MKKLGIIALCITFVLVCLLVFVPEGKTEYIYESSVSTVADEPIELLTSIELNGKPCPKSIMDEVYASEQVQVLSREIPVKLIYRTCYYNDYIMTYQFGLSHTDAVVNYTEGSVSSVYNKFGAAYPIIYFKDEVPANASEIYERVYNNLGYVVGYTKDGYLVAGEVVYSLE